MKSNLKDDAFLLLLAKESGIDYKNLKNANITSDEWVELSSVAARLAKEIQLLNKE